MNKKIPLSALALIMAAPALQANDDLESRVAALEDGRIGNTTFSVGGYIKLDAQFTRFTDGEGPGGRVGNEFIVPSTIPVGGRNSQTEHGMHANESRLNVGTSTDTDLGTVSTFLEVDFLGSAQGDERITNSYSPRLRHAFIQFADMTVGQTWSTFYDVRSLPDLLDFVGPVGTVFSRQAQIRYSPGNWDFALENPESTLYEEDGTPESFDNNSMPDLIARYNLSIPLGEFSVAGMGREIAYKDEANGNRERAFGYGVSLSAIVPVGDSGNDLRAQLSGGNAMGRYLSLNGFRAAQIEADGDIDLIDQYGGFVAYRHLWSPQWRSNLSLSHAWADNPSTVSADTAKSYSSAHANLIYSPIDNLDLGGELIWAERENENGSAGEAHRVQFSAKLSF